MKKNRFIFLPFFLIVLVFSSCCLYKKNVNIADFSYDLAVLPIKVDSQYIEFKQYFEEDIFNRLKQTGFDVPSLKTINDMFIGNNITDDVNIYSRKKLSTILNSKNLLYIEISTVSVQKNGPLFTGKVNTEIRIVVKTELYDALRGEFLWTKNEKQSEQFEREFFDIFSFLRTSDSTKIKKMFKRISKILVRHLVIEEKKPLTVFEYIYYKLWLPVVE